MKGRVLITGASGLIGKRLSALLKKEGYAINTIGRAGSKQTSGNNYSWDINKMVMDVKALDGVTHIVHLAGAGVVEQRWNTARKKEILDSRINSTRLLYNTLQKTPNTVNTIISASAVGYYGDCGDTWVDETHAAGSDFLADVCKQWEGEVIKFSGLGIREVRCRIGIVLAQNGGALPELYKTVPMGIAPYFAKTPLYYPWIHADDVCGIIYHAIKNDSISGAYNTNAPNPLPVKDLMEAIVKGSGKRALIVPAPPFAIRLAVGEMADVILASQRCSSKKIVNSGYRFIYTDATKAIAAVLAK